MTALELFAAVGMPALVVAIAGAAVLLNKWDLKRRRNRLHPGE